MDLLVIVQVVRSLVVSSAVHATVEAVIARFLPGGRLWLPALRVLSIESLLEGALRHGSVILLAAGIGHVDRGSRLVR